MAKFTIKNNTKFDFPIIIGMLAFLWLMVNLLPIPVEGQFEPKWVNPVLAAIILAACIFSYKKMSRRELAIDENGLVYTPFFGAPRKYSYSDIEKIYTGGKKYVIYTTDGNKLISFDDCHTDNASRIIQFLKSMGVREEK